MNCTEKSLLPGESAYYKGKLHPIIFLRGWRVALLGLMILHFRGPKLLAFSLLGLAAIVAMISCITFATSEFSITNKRVIMKCGWLKRSSLDLFVDQVESVSVSQGILARIANFGQVRVKGIGGTTETFYYIASPGDFRRQIQVLHAR